MNIQVRKNGLSPRQMQRIKELYNDGFNANQIAYKIDAKASDVKPVLTTLRVTSKIFKHDHNLITI